MMMHLLCVGGVSMAQHLETVESCLKAGMPDVH